MRALTVTPGVPDSAELRTVEEPAAQDGQVVRHPDPVPCRACAAGEWDMCRNGRFNEHGISGRHGFARERYRAEPDRLVRPDARIGRLGVLLEPASVVAKAWEHTERIGSRATWSPQSVLVTGAGTIGLLAALLAVQRGLDVHVVDLVEDGPKPDLVRALGATYSSTSVPVEQFAEALVSRSGDVKTVLTFGVDAA